MRFNISCSYQISDYCSLMFFLLFQNLRFKMYLSKVNTAFPFWMFYYFNYIRRTHNLTVHIRCSPTIAFLIPAFSIFNKYSCYTRSHKQAVMNGRFGIATVIVKLCLGKSGRVNSWTIKDALSVSWYPQNWSHILQYVMYTKYTKWINIAMNSKIAWQIMCFGQKLKTQNQKTQT